MPGGPAARPAPRCSGTNGVAAGRAIFWECVAAGPSKEGAFRDTVFGPSKVDDGLCRLCGGIWSWHFQMAENPGLLRRNPRTKPGRIPSVLLAGKDTETTSYREVKRVRSLAKPSPSDTLPSRMRPHHRDPLAALAPGTCRPGAAAHHWAAAGRGALHDEPLDQSGRPSHTPG